MKESLITFDLAVLAKQKGFNLESCRNGWHGDFGPLVGDDYPFLGTYSYYVRCLCNNKEEHQIQRPTQSELQTWLRDDEKVMVWLEPVGKDNHDSVLWTWKLIDWSKNNDTVDGFCKLSYEDALEAGLITALNLYV